MPVLGRDGSPTSNEFDAAFVQRVRHERARHPPNPDDSRERFSAPGLASHENLGTRPHDPELRLV